MALHGHDHTTPSSPLRSPSRLNFPQSPSSSSSDHSPSNLGHQQASGQSSRYRLSNVNASTYAPSAGISRQTPPKLTGLPRFHPANFTPSASASITSPSAASMDGAPGMSTGPLSPRTSNQLRQYSEAQRQLYLYHRELINLNRSTGTSGMTSPGWRSGRPLSPQLKPTGSPGPITPFELEIEADQSEGYLMAGAGAGHARASGTPLSDTAKEEILEDYILKETRSSPRSLPGGSTQLS